FDQSIQDKSPVVRVCIDCNTRWEGCPNLKTVTFKQDPPYNKHPSYVMSRISILVFGDFCQSASMTSPSSAIM
ncbi:MAG: hypothetical protein WA460_10940, partial [Nitrososphaeraceae archaeon]